MKPPELSWKKLPNVAIWKDIDKSCIWVCVMTYACSHVHRRIVTSYCMFLCVCAGARENTCVLVHMYETSRTTVIRCKQATCYTHSQLYHNHNHLHLHLNIALLTHRVPTTPKLFDSFFITWWTPGDSIAWIGPIKIMSYFGIWHIQFDFVRRKPSPPKKTKTKTKNNNK